MRKRVAQNSGDFWTQLPLNEREQIKVKLPELILAEPKYVSSSTVRVLLFQHIYIYNITGTSFATQPLASWLRSLRSSSPTINGPNCFPSSTKHLHHLRSHIVRWVYTCSTLSWRISWKGSKSICKVSSSCLSPCWRIPRAVKLELLLLGELLVFFSSSQNIAVVYCISQN
jgi:hypothetical protein